ncbi:Alpha-galactosidase [Caldicellulosiruptor hydrothermalis 108]|uniref:Alpha-galactosidase n=1 Tax=Caldicellulosiruptor hydrothermalis (strain DSM 18901 / VKM B-2411 / 108) TaxID=632292 RepID=E4Q7X3_CALH1|nr:alpha-galactosidase [Caldicellulosiruptor hydrothermalis]ADQ07891.1 Alpha-galactosidase [Caldicellulosiruptor hydrothermalis 108]
MPIKFNPQTSMFFIEAKDTSYVIKLFKGKYLAHVYWGKKIKEFEWMDIDITAGRVFGATPDPNDKTYSFETMPQEYPAYGNSDFRHPAYQIEQEDGSRITNLVYKTHRIYDGKPKLEGLPTTYVESSDEAQTLEIELYDDLIDLKVTLIYTAYKDYDAITRSVRFENLGKQKLKILRAMSACVDFPEGDFELLHLWGSWARERYIERTPLIHGTQIIESARGESSHQHNPFIALLSKGATEKFGDVYGFSLVYSGNFAAIVEKDQYNLVRVTIGINPFEFTWVLDPGEKFQTPEVVMVYSQDGLGGMSRTYHKLYRKRLCRGAYRDKRRPILINSWEAAYFNFNEEKLLALAKEAKELGIELFVLDDGWFGKRDDDTSSLGDWFVDRRKLPNGLDGLGKKLNEMGLKFGLWFEPEMVSPDSELYRKHPDWCIQVRGRTLTQCRNQYVLDITREDVRKEILRMMKEILRTAPIEYIKWDMNRPLTEAYSLALPPERQKEVFHRYVLGLYQMMEELTTEFPHILFEGCSGGGGRFDPGILYYMPQIWTSDDTDAIERLKIQFGTSIVYPASTMGAHVSIVPNHQVGRITPMKTRGVVALSGCFGYELDLTKLSQEDKEEIKRQIELYKRIWHIIFEGDLYRLISPFEENVAAWMFVTEDKNEAVVFYVNILGEPNPPIKRLKLDGLDPDKKYIIEGDEKIRFGDELMNIGIMIPRTWGDFNSHMWILKAILG